MARRWAVVATVAIFGGESLKNPRPADPQPAPSPPSGAASEATPPPGEKWKTRADPGAPVPHLSPRGEVDPRASRGSGEVASQPPPGDRGQVVADDPLALAAEALRRGDRPAAAVHLEVYVRAHPDQIVFRAQLAEMLVTAGRDDAARVHFERFAADARRAAGPARDHLVHAHTRLVEIARRDGDRFSEAFHRGAGLLVLVAGEDGKADRDDGFCEEMLCQAVKALAEAKDLRPGDPRPRAELADAHDRAGNRRAADAERAAARGAFVTAGRPPDLH